MIYMYVCEILWNITGVCVCVCVDYPDKEIGGFGRGELFLKFLGLYCLYTEW